MFNVFYIGFISILCHLYFGTTLFSSNLETTTLADKTTVKVPYKEISKAYFAGGCFWGIEYYLEQEYGVLSVESGYMGGQVKNPTYRDVSSGKSGHLEVVEVSYDSQKTTYEKLAKLFFEIHDPTQENGQGPDIGSQYLSVIFVSNSKERKTIGKLMKKLTGNGYKVTTKVLDKKIFYKAEKYHQDYYERKGYKPYCHGYIKRF